MHGTVRLLFERERVLHSLLKRVGGGGSSKIGRPRSRGWKNFGWFRYGKKHFVKIVTSFVTVSLKNNIMFTHLLYIYKKPIF